MNKNKKTKYLANLLILGLLRKPKYYSDYVNLIYIKNFWNENKDLLTKLSVFSKFITSPIYILIDAIFWISNKGIYAKKLSGKSLIKQFLEQIYFAFFFSINSESYYFYNLYFAKGIEKGRMYIDEFVLKNGVYKVLINYGRILNKGIKTCSLGKKVKFYNYFIDKGLPVVPVLLEFTKKGEIRTYLNNIKDLPEESIFCKPNIGKEGNGAELWLWDKQKKVFYNINNFKLTYEELKKRMFDLAYKNQVSMVIQPLVLPHTNLRIFRKSATPTVRIISTVDKNREISLDLAMFRCSTNRASIVDNASAGGIVIPINILNGTLGSAICSRTLQVNDEINGLYKDGFVLPYWNETLELVKKAHKEVPDRLLIGWDIIITDSGPIILEANSQPGIRYIQKAHNLIISQTKLGENLAQLCKEAIEKYFITSNI